MHVLVQITYNFLFSACSQCHDALWAACTVSPAVCEVCQCSQTSRLQQGLTRIVCQRAHRMLPLRTQVYTVPSTAVCTGAQCTSPAQIHPQPHIAHCQVYRTFAAAYTKSVARLTSRGPCVICTGATGKVCSTNIWYVAQVQSIYCCIVMAIHPDQFHCGSRICLLTSHSTM